ncbi:MAG: NAD(P)-dependent alcohol dehydrogenase, partial [Fimbriimonadaceae bacterium]|nr:NAD(P)-dependent alcohol dehydrogenase [Fimbriimonadaceae bacterium]
TEATPVPQPGPGQILVRVRAAGVSSGDARVRGANFPGPLRLIGRLMMGVFRPRRSILGTDFAGEVAALGEGVQNLQTGDRVYGAIPFTDRSGTHAEYVLAKSDGFVRPIPPGVSFQQAGALCFGMTTARHFLMAEAGLTEGQSLLVIGGGGSVGTAAIQSAHDLGARVTAVCSSRTADLARSLGADHVVDYTRQEISDPNLGSAPYDVVLDCMGTSSPDACLPVLRPGGVFIPLVFTGPALRQALKHAFTKRIRVILGVSEERPEDIDWLTDRLESGRVVPVIDSVLPMDEVAEAHRRVETGRKQGNVVLQIP